MNVEQIGIHAESVNGGSHAVVLEPNRPLSPMLLVTGFKQQGYMLEIRDPYGAPVWSIMLNCEGAIDTNFDTYAGINDV